MKSANNTIPPGARQSWDSSLRLLSAATRCATSAFPTKTGFNWNTCNPFCPTPLVVNQVKMSLLHHGFAEVSVSFNQNSPRYPDGWEGTMEYCRKKDVLLQAWSPLAQGVLMGNLGAQPDNIKETAALVQEYAQRHETTAEGILLAWLLKHPAKIQPVLGTTTPNRLRACAKALRICLVP